MKPAKQEARCPVALCLIDVINAMDFEGSEALVKQAVQMAPKLKVLKSRAKSVGIPSIYINDNFGTWRSDFRALVKHCTQDRVPGRSVARILRPDPDDYFVLKPKHSAFYGTTLNTLLHNLGATQLILAGIAANICVLFSASDAYMRDFRLVVPSDCVVSNTLADTRYALKLMQAVFKADITISSDLGLKASRAGH